MLLIAYITLKQITLTLYPIWSNPSIIFLKSELALTGDCVIALTNEIGCGEDFALNWIGWKIMWEKWEVSKQHYSTTLVSALID